MKISRDKKKDFELHLLRKFISHESHYLHVKTIDEGETPDFIIREFARRLFRRNNSVDLTRPDTVRAVPGENLVPRL